MRRLAFVPLALCLLFPGTKAWSSSVRTVFASQAQGSNGGSLVTLEVWPGYDLIIDFIPTGEVVREVLLSDQSSFGVGSLAGKLCSPMGNEGDSQTCSNAGAKLIYVRRIKFIDFNLIHSVDGGTQLVLITEGAQGLKRYLFRIVSASGIPKYTTVDIKPDSDKPIPLLQAAQPRQQQLLSHPLPSNRLARKNFAVATKLPSSQLPVITPSPRLESPLPTHVTIPIQNPSSTSIQSHQIKPRNLVIQQNTPSLATNQFTSKPVNPPTPEQTNLELVIHQSDGRQTRYKVLLNPSSEPQPDTTTNLASMPTPIRSVTPTLNKPLPPYPVAVNSQSEANAAVLGLQKANTRGEIRPGTKIWKQVNTAIFLLRRGEPKEHAADKAGLSLAVLNQLIAWGQNHP